MEYSEKQADFLTSKAKIEWLEGTSFSGKTTIASPKLLLKVMASKYGTHLLLGVSRGKIEDNVLGNPMEEGTFLNIYQEKQKIVEYFPNGHGQISDAHLIVHCRDKNGNRVDKIIYIWGAYDISAVAKIRGGVYGCCYVDEANMCYYEAIQEAKMRSNDWFCGSMNPDSPDKPIYKLVNRSRPLTEWVNDVPKEILCLLNEREEKNSVYWHFNFHDNPVATEEIIEQKSNAFEIGSAKYNSLILGLRTKCEGIIFDCLSQRNIIEENKIFYNMDNWDKEHPENHITFIKFTAGLDTSFSSNTPDTNALMFAGITNDGKIYVLEEFVLNNRDLPENQRKYASDLCVLVDYKLSEWKRKWGYFDTFFIDCADANMIGEFGKYRRKHGSDFHQVQCNKKTFNIKARNDKINEWLQTGCMFISDKCRNFINECYTYAYDQETGKPIDKNNHTIDAFNYSWTTNNFKLIGKYAK